MTDIIETLLKRNLHAVFGERDPARRRDAIAELFTEDCIFSDSHGRHVGHAALDAAVAKLQAQFPHYVFTERGAAEALRDAGRLAWIFGPAGETPHITGLDVIVVREGRIAALYGFLDPPKALDR